MGIDLTLKSTAVADAVAVPPVLHNPGMGGQGIVKQVYGYIASVTAALSATSVIRLCQVPSNAVVDSVVISSDAQGAGKFNIGVYLPNGGLVAFTNSDSFFTADLDCASAVIDQQCVMKATSRNTIAKRNQPLWQAIGMAADPGGVLDIAATVHTTDVTTGTGALSAKVAYMQ